MSQERERNFRLQGYESKGYWICSTTRVVNNLWFSGWKIHVLIESSHVWGMILDILIPYCKDRNLQHKFIHEDIVDHFHHPDNATGKQRFKGFTIYCIDKDDLIKVLHEVDNLLCQYGLQIAKEDNLKIIGDKRYGNSGRVWYRYDLNTKAYQNHIFNMGNPESTALYNQLYESNRGNDSYLAKDMNQTDDPFYHWGRR